MRAQDSRLFAVFLLLLAGAISAARSFPFLWYPFAYFNGDQGVFGLMAKHLAEGSGFPLYFYGQRYLLAVNAWLAAIPFSIAGSSAFNLKIPSFILNILAAPVLMWLLVRESRITWLQSFLAASFISAAPVILSAYFMSPAFASLEAIYYVLAIWLLRRSPIMLGAFSPFLMAARTYSLYGLLLLLFLLLRREWLAIQGGWRSRLVSLWRTLSISHRHAAVRFVFSFMFSKLFLLAISTAATDSRGRHAPGPSVEALFQLPENLEFLLTSCFPVITGVANIRYSNWGIVADGGYDARWLGIICGIGFLIVLIQMFHKKDRVEPIDDFCLYLVGVGVLSVIAFLSFLQLPPYSAHMRYVMVAVLVPVGLTAWVLRAQWGHWSGKAWGGLIVVWVLTQSVAYAGFISSMVKNPPVGEGEQVLATLRNEGFQFAQNDGLFAHEVTFVSDETVIVHRTERVIVERHRSAVETAVNKGAVVPLIVKRAKECPVGSQRKRASRLHDLCIPDSSPLQ